MITNILLIALILFLTSAAVFSIYKLVYAFNHFRMKQLTSVPALLENLPSVSVCIPARNETHAMTQCLENVIASRYPKLEIIVLDDSSVDNTSILIKSFAHAGVRFVQGSPLKDGWLGRNYALNGLMEEASGSFILFMDVDTIIEPDTIGQLVAYATQENANMISVLPQRADKWRMSLFMTTLRYLRELLLHKKNNPAVASNAWMINRRVLQQELGGFEDCKVNIQPEAYFASILMLQNKYRFLIGTKLLGVNYEKKWLSQIETGVRLSYPIFGGSILSNLRALSAMFIIAAMPIVALSSIFTGIQLVQIVAIIFSMIFALIYGVFLSRTWRSLWWFGMLFWPLIAVQELVVMTASLVGYTRKTITWKGRPIVTEVSGSR